jgi:hypothetical protein
MLTLLGVVTLGVIAGIPGVLIGLALGGGDQRS